MFPISCFASIFPAARRFVIKQCRERLRVAMEWHARLERIWTEQAAMELLGAILPAGTVPLIEFEDRPNYLFGMTCAPDDAVTWKSQLMGGMLDPDIAVRLGIILATIHDKAPGQSALSTQLSRSERRPSTIHDADPEQPALDAAFAERKATSTIRRRTVTHGHPRRHQPLRRAARRPLLSDHRARPSRFETADRHR